jgi:hypothetical protein
MVTVRTHWSADTPALADVKALADELVAVLEGHNSEVIGPAMSMAFLFTVLELGKHNGDMEVLSRMMEDLSAFVVRYGAATVRHPH